jgi:hypothetical protein
MSDKKVEYYIGYHHSGVPDAAMLLASLMAARSLPSVAMHDLGGRSREHPITKIHALRWMARSKNVPFRDLERRDGSPFTSLFEL